MYTPFISGVFARDHRPDPVHRPDARLRAATGTRPGPESMTKEQIAATVTAISDLMQALRYATTEDKAEIYPGLKPGCGTRYPSFGPPLLVG
jgi:hypothetical protein